VTSSTEPQLDAHTPCHSFGGVFAEVAVDPDFGMTRVRRVVAVYDVGRIINHRTARSQFIGGIVWGISLALHENDSVGARGIGEIGITGTGAAICNAIYHATGKRVRDLPITPEKLL